MSNLHYSRRLLLHTLLYQTQPTTEPPTPSHDASFHGGFDANLIMILSVLLCALICSLCVNSLIKCVFKCSSLLGGEPNYYINTIRELGVTREGGVDKRALRSFPIVKFSKEVKIQGLDTECVICLSEFKASERLRILPKCNHGFHVKCIDKWLKSHTSCPTCRHSLIDTCQKIIGCDNHNHNQDTSSSSSTSSTVAINTGEMIAISIIVPLEREDMVRNHRG